MHDIAGERRGKPGLVGPPVFQFRVRETPEVSAGRSGCFRVVA